MLETVRDQSGVTTVLVTFIALALKRLAGTATGRFHDNARFQSRAPRTISSSIPTVSRNSDRDLIRGCRGSSFRRYRHSCDFLVGGASVDFDFVEPAGSVSRCDRACRIIRRQCPGTRPGAHRYPLQSTGHGTGAVVDVVACSCRGPHASTHRLVGPSGLHSSART